jgi:hypothetical protein
MPLQGDLTYLLKKLRPKIGNISQPHRSQAIELVKICRQLVPESPDYSVSSEDVER